MKGTHIIKVRDRRIVYELKIRRNITIIRGDSATGKTTLLEMLDTYVRLGEESGIYLECDVPVDVYMSDDRRKNWRERLSEAGESIIFVEEMNPFVQTKEFAEFLIHSRNYYVFVTRWNLKNLPYSVSEIYKLTEKGRYPGTHQIYNELEQYYSAESDIDQKEICTVVTEDAGSGHDFFQQLSIKAGLQCSTAYGNSNMIKIMRQNKKISALYIADGAAFGAFMDECVQYMKYYGRKNCHLWLPESFEYLILNSGIIKIPGLAEILQNTSDYVESSVYVSWERFFSALLVEKTQGTIQKYSKAELSDYYRSDTMLYRIAECMPEKVREIFIK